jgi:fibro-slime domain-containing protein
MACGARTGLEVCTASDSQRSCRNACGTGTQTCTGGVWTACETAPSQRACDNACGTGLQTCRDGVWSDCAVPDAARICAAPCGLGQQICVDGAWQACHGPEAGVPVISAQLWDFQPGVPPDFGAPRNNANVGLDPGIVSMTLGADDTPVYAGQPTTRSTHGAADFGDWYHDTAVNLSTPVTLAFGPLASDATTYASNNASLFPVDNRLFGNDTGTGDGGAAHNYFFTLAFTLHFRYRGGETFHFASDDDSWVFINRRLAVDLGGLHTRTAASVDLDSKSAFLGIAVGQAYVMNVFYADREPFQAVLDVDVPAADFMVCDDGGLPP